MADISKLSRLIGGVQRQVDLSSNALVVGSLKVGSVSPTELTKTILDKLVLIQTVADADGSYDSRYFTETELQSTTPTTSGATKIGVSGTPSNYTPTAATAQGHFEGINAAIALAGGTSFSDAMFEIYQDGDPTAKSVFDLSALSAATTRTISMPDTNVDLGLIASAIQSSEKGAANGVATLDADQLIPIAQIPPAALERLVIVADEAARFALTTATVQNGDTVKQTDTEVMYFVKDDTELDNAAGYAVYSAGTASAVAWSGVTGTPTTLAGYGITDGYTDADAKAAAVADAINDGVTDIAPSQNAVFDALALKQDASAELNEAETFFAATNITGSEAEQLTDGSNADSLHTHSKLVKNAVAGEAFTAALWAVRYAKAADVDFVAGRVYKADIDAASVDNFYAIGLARPAGSVSAAGAITVVKSGEITATAHGFTVGAPLFLDASGAVTATAPSADNMAVVRVGIAIDANTIEVQIQVMGIA